MPLTWNIEVSEFEFEFHSVLATGEPLLSVCLVQRLCATLSGLAAGKPPPVLCAVQGLAYNIRLRP